MPAEFITASSPSSVAATIVRPGKSGTACETVPPRWYEPSFRPFRSNRWTPCVKQLARTIEPSPLHVSRPTLDINRSCQATSGSSRPGVRDVPSSTPASMPNVAAPTTNGRSGTKQRWAMGWIVSIRPAALPWRLTSCTAPSRLPTAT